MVALVLCFECQPEGRDMGFGLTAPPPRHCEGRHDQVREGVIGGVRCPCACNRSVVAPRERPAEPGDDGSSREAGT